MKRIVFLALVVTLMCSNGLWAAKAPVEKDSGYPVLKAVDFILAHAPKLVREAAELYCIRLELIGHLYSKNARDKNVNRTIRSLARTVRNLGMGALNAVMELRERVPHAKLLKMIQRWRGNAAKRQKKSKKAAVRAEQRIGQRIGRRIGQSIRRRLGKMSMLHAQLKEMVKALRLTENQRQDLKFQVISSVPAIVRGGAALIADGMQLGREVIKPKASVKKCTTLIVQISDGVSRITKSALDLAFALKSRLTDKQQGCLGANLPLQLILFRFN